MEVTSAEDYVKLVSTMVELPTGAVFHVRAPNPIELAHILKVMPEEGIPEDFKLFATEYLPELWGPVIHPCILEPKVPADMVHYEDAFKILEAIFSMSGMAGGGEDESFPDAEPSTDA